MVLIIYHVKVIESTSGFFRAAPCKRSSELSSPNVNLVFIISIDSPDKYNSRHLQF